MFLVEPSPSEGDVHFSLFGYPVRINPWFWLTAVMLGLGLKEPMLVALWVVAMLLCILLHELGHAVVMKSYGFFPSIVLYSFGGMAIPRSSGYNVRRPGPWGDMLIAFAGPATGFILAAALVLGLHNLGGYPLDFYLHVVPRVDIPNNGILNDFVFFVLQISVLWGVINLLPIFPLDGGQIALQLFSLNNPQDALRPSLILSIMVGITVTVLMAMQILTAKEGNNVLGFLPVVFFGYLTYSNYERLQSLNMPGGWR